MTTLAPSDGRAKRHKPSRLARLLTRPLALYLVLLVAAPAATTAAEAPQIFASTAVRNDNLELFPKWRGTLDRYFEDRQVEPECSPGRFDSCDLLEWQAFLDGQALLDPQRQLEAVNRHMNEHRYIVDPRNWGVEDYWATPLQFFRKDGDCEDYAIAKFMSLRALGWRDEDLRIVVVDDRNLRAQHAVLVAFLDGRAYVLDNQSASVMLADRIRHYRPIYSLNESAWWLHRS